MSDLREVLHENSYLRQKQLLFADCARYQRARESTLLSIAAAVARCRAVGAAMVGSTHDPALMQALGGEQLNLGQGWSLEG